MLFKEYYEFREEIDIEEEINLFEQYLMEVKKTHPSKGMSKKKKSEFVKRAKRGEDIFGGGKHFDKIAKGASKKYGSEEAGKRVAGAIFWKKASGKKGMTKEDVDDILWIVEDDIDIILDAANLNEKNWIQGAIKHPGRCTPITKKGCTGRAKALALRFKKGDIHKDNEEK